MVSISISQEADQIRYLDLITMTEVVLISITLHHLLPTQQLSRVARYNLLNLLLRWFLLKWKLWEEIDGISCTGKKVLTRNCFCFDKVFKISSSISSQPTTTVQLTRECIWWFINRVTCLVSPPLRGTVELSSTLLVTAIIILQLHNLLLYPFRLQKRSTTMPIWE